MKTILKWPGNKARELKHIIEHIPANFNTYIEPFVGGGALFFHLEYNNSVISDTHTELINFYLQLKNNTTKLIEQIQKWNINKKTYYYVRDDLWKESNQIIQAARFYYLNKNAFRGMMRYGKGGKFNIPYGLPEELDVENKILDCNFFHNAAKLLLKTEILNLSFENIFNMYDSNDTFIFLDPPYDTTYSNYGFGNFGENEHRQLALFFKNCQSKCLLVISNTKLINELYKDYIVKTYEKNYSIRVYQKRIQSKHTKAKHLIIKNY